MEHSQRQPELVRSHHRAFWSSIGLRPRHVAAVLLIVLVASPASAQYFGRNKVRYRAFDFQVMKTEHFDIYFYPTEREGVEIAARLAERWYARLERLFSHALYERQPLVLYASHADFQQTNIVSGELSEGTGGITEGARRRIVLPFAGAIRDTDHVLGHELVHAFQFDVAMPPGGDVGQTPFVHLPDWFVEGMAEYISLGRVDAHTAMKLRDAVHRNELPSILELHEPKYFPYQWGHAVFAYIAGRYGDPAVARLLRAGADFGSVEAAIKTALGISAHELSKDWHAAMRELHDPVLASSAPLRDRDRLACRGQNAGTGSSFAPSLSPDGRLIAFLSTRSLFATDLYVGDVKTGRTLRRLTQMATNPHDMSIHFTNSSGTWDGSGKHFAIPTTLAGRAALTIFDVRTGKRDRDIVVRGIDEIRSASWAPDGHAIAFAGMRQGLTDLFVYDLGEGTIEQLTNDAYADLHPAWSPDSRRIVFATDRYSSDLDSLRMGDLRLAIADTGTGALEAVPAFDKGKQINPQWSRRREALYFVADPDGIPNVYRLSLASREIEQMTALGVGVSGITSSSPALSISAGGDQLAVSLYQDERYDICLGDGLEPFQGRAALPHNAAVLSPNDGSGAGRPVLSAAADSDLPRPQAYPVTPYQATMSLAGDGQSAAGIGIGNFGVAGGGGTSLVFSDMLGDRLLATSVQVGGSPSSTFSFNDVAFNVGYLRQDHRWKWGFVSEQIPYVTGAFESVEPASGGGDSLETYQQTVVRETRRSGSGVLMYPFNRARRLELAGGFAQTSRELIVTSIVYSAATDEFLPGNTDTRGLGRRVELATSAAALISDTTIFGPASPIQGERYRLEIAPNVGSIDFTAVLVDYRRYVMPVAFYTIAARIIHYGRYGGGAEDARLYPIYINDPGLVRGYGTLQPLSAGCLVSSADMCQRSRGHVGSRILVGNVELRFPLLRPFGARHGMYGPVPIELALFGDTGVAWNRGEKPALAGGSRPGISSVGMAVRIALGFAAAEFDVTRPFQRPEDGWTFGLNLIPGW
jgi:Tol biopolymer transport system component